MYGLTRGERNNNPMNIRLSSAPWHGKITPSKDSAFEQFDTAIDGIRAGAKILVNYYKLHGLQTIQGIISRWAPGSENNTAAYITDVCSHMAIGPNDVIDLADAEVLYQLVSAIIYHENGAINYPTLDIQEAVSMVDAPATA